MFHNGSLIHIHLLLRQCRQGIGSNSVFGFLPFIGQSHLTTDSWGKHTYKPPNNTCSNFAKHIKKNTFSSHSIARCIWKVRRNGAETCFWWTCWEIKRWASLFKNRSKRTPKPQEAQQFTGPLTLQFYFYTIGRELHGIFM
jgi:hypothetical protein